MISTEKTEDALQLTEAERLHHQQQQQEYLNLYRQSLVRLQKEDPEAAARMPGFNAHEIEERERDILEEMGKISYSKRYADLTSQYRHVILPKNIAKWVPTGRLMKEAEWRTLGVIMSPGWIHYLIHEPEPHILLFKRPLSE